LGLWHPARRSRPVAPAGPELAATPFPVSVIVVALASLPASATIAVLTPGLLGVKRTVIVQLCSNTNVRPEHASAVIAKSAALGPLS
jgi:hypothetical protein